MLVPDVAVDHDSAFPLGVITLPATIEDGHSVAPSCILVRKKGWWTLSQTDTRRVFWFEAEPLVKPLHDAAVAHNRLLLSPDATDQQKHASRDNVLAKEAAVRLCLLQSLHDRRIAVPEALTGPPPQAEQAQEPEPQEPAQHGSSPHILQAYQEHHQDEEQAPQGSPPPGQGSDQQGSTHTATPPPTRPAVPPSAPAPKRRSARSAQQPPPEPQQPPPAPQQQAQQESTQLADPLQKPLPASFLFMGSERALPKGADGRELVGRTVGPGSGRSTQLGLSKRDLIAAYKELGETWPKSKGPPGQALLPEARLLFAQLVDTGVSALGKQDADKQDREQEEREQRAELVQLILGLEAASIPVSLSSMEPLSSHTANLPVLDDVVAKQRAWLKAQAQQAKNSQAFGKVEVNTGCTLPLGCLTMRT